MLLVLCVVRVLAAAQAATGSVAQPTAGGVHTANACWHALASERRRCMRAAPPPPPPDIPRFDTTPPHARRHQAHGWWGA
jgi:hypothetical protein